jgi:hypothetical protein
VCNPDSDFWTTISHKKGGKQVFGMINAPNGSAATSVDWQAVEDCVSTYSSELSGICVDIEKSSQCSLSQTDVNALNHIAEVRVAVSEGTCGQAWPARA